MTPERNTITVGDALEVLRGWPDGFVQCCITSPPYWGLRDYGTATWEGGDPECDHMVDRFASPVSDKQASNAASGSKRARDTCPKCGARRIDQQLGLEQRPEDYVARLVEIFREVKRVLRDDGTLWLNLGDSYASNPASGGNQSDKMTGGEHKRTPSTGAYKRPSGLKPKNLCGIPWRVAFALQADGYWLRQDIIWSKKNPMPSSVTDRCTTSHEYLFLLTKRARYFWDAEAIKEESVSFSGYRGSSGSKSGAGGDRNDGGRSNIQPTSLGRNRRSVWTIATQAFPGAHFATFPEALVAPCVLAGTSERGCCPHCGSAWERVVDKTRTFESGSGRSGRDPVGKHGPGLQGGGETGDIRRGPCVQSRTTGWAATCDCYPPEETAATARDTRPCIVLDPFMGSGTVGLVASKLGRDYLGIELNPEYAEMARLRIENRVPDSALVKQAGQLSFLDSEASQ